MGKAKRAKQKRKRQRWVVLSLLGLVAAGLGVALLTSSDDGFVPSTNPPRAPGDRYETVAADQLPSFATGNPKVEDAYRFAAAHPDVLQYIPCFCGCGNIGHRHNGDCYVQDRLEDGRITFTSHAAT
jgi:hypothetical protein